MQLYQVDIATAFLYGLMDAKIYCSIPPGMNLHPGFAAELKKFKKPILQILGSLYGAKQAQRIWNAKFTNFLIKVVGCKQCRKDPCLFICRNKLGLLLLINGDIQKWFLDKIKTQFKISHEGLAEHFLSEDIVQDQETFEVSVSWHTYINSMLEDLGLTDIKAAASPSVPNLRLERNMGPPCDTPRYRTRVGMLIFLACRRMDITHPVNQVARYSHQPKEGHWSATTRIFRYLKGTRELRVLYSDQRARSDMHAYSDSDWAGNREDYRSTTGAAVFLCGPLSFRSKLQPTQALSSAEAEYMALSSTAQDVLFFRQVLEELGLTSLLTQPTEILVDNTAAIALSEHNRSHKRTKHIALRYHFVRSACYRGEVRVSWVPTVDQLADILTKPGGVKAFIRLVRLIFLIP